MPFAPAAISGPAAATLLNVFVQLCVIMAVARAFSWLARRLGQPGVVGEIAAGLLLGPSAFGALFPDAFHSLFASSPAADTTFRILSQLGLVFLLFLVGLEFDFRHLKRDARGAVGVSIAGIAVPFALGWGLASLMGPHLATGPGEPSHASPLLLALFMGTAMSITAIPVLGRIMIELNITRSRIGTLTITASAFDDAAGWILLAAVSSLASSRFEGMATLKMIGLTAACAAAVLMVVRPLTSRWWLWLQSRGRAGGDDTAATIIVLLLLCAVATHLIGISAVFGAFLFGAAMSGTPGFREAMREKMTMFVSVFFLPIFFTYTGLRTDIGALSSGTMWLFCGLLLALAVAGKLGGCALAARLSGFNWREAACIGAMMNTRGLMALVVATLGLEVRIIPGSVFCMLVIMALATTAMTTPMLLRLSRGTELEPMIKDSELARRRGA